MQESRAKNQTKMKRLLIFCLLLTISLSAPAKSRPDKPRNWAQINFLGNGQKYDKSQARVFTTTGYVHWKEMSLKSFDRDKLNDIELDLMEKYSDVIITRMFKCYFLLDEDGRIGVADIYGNELIPPIAGNVRQCGKYFLVGELTDDFSDIKTMPNYGSINTSYSVAYPMGLCKSVVTMGAVSEVIPFSKYDYIAPVPKGLNGVRGFYVYNMDENNNKLWGYCDKKGKEVVPCQFRSVVYNGKEFSGSNTWSMDEVMESYERKVNMMAEIRAQRAQMWAEVLNSLGQTMVSVAQTMPSSSGTSAGSSTGTVSGGNYATRYAQWERRAEQNYNSITNLGISVTSDNSASGTSGGSGHISSSNYSAMKKALREAQNEMRKIRLEAQRAGVNIPQSKWETATVNY